MGLFLRAEGEDEDPLEDEESPDDVEDDVEEGPGEMNPEGEEKDEDP